MNKRFRLPLPPAVGPLEVDELGRPRILPDALHLIFSSIGRAALGATIFPGLGDQWRDTVQSYVDRNGKWTKFQTIYSPIAPLPAFWEYPCATCWAFERETRTCKWVSERGFPNPGIIHEQGWCIVWVPLEGDPPFSYVGKLPWFVREPPPVFP